MLTHLDKDGNARMVDVSAKEPTRRVARAQSIVIMSPQTLELIMNGKIPKGDVLGAVRIAGIMAAKKTPELIPLCHPIALKQAQVEVEVIAPCKLQITGEVVAFDTTGVEMEALTMVTVAALTVVDMCKAVDKRMVIANIHLLSKTGGKSGDFVWEEENYEVESAEVESDDR